MGSFNADGEGLAYEVKTMRHLDIYVSTDAMEIRHYLDGLGFSEDDDSRAVVDNCLHAEFFYENFRIKCEDLKTAEALELRNLVGFAPMAKIRVCGENVDLSMADHNFLDIVGGVVRLLKMERYYVTHTDGKEIFKCQ